MIRVCLTEWLSPDGAGLSEKPVTVSVIRLTIHHPIKVRKVELDVVPRSLKVVMALGAEPALAGGHDSASVGAVAPAKPLTPCGSAGTISAKPYRPSHICAPDNPPTQLAPRIPELP
jgi:hypothetical protein